MTVWVVKYAPGEPNGVYWLAIALTKEGAEKEMLRLCDEERFTPDELHVEEEEVLE